MIAIHQTLDRLTQPQPLKEDEYLGSNGLIHCSSCHTPRQLRIRAGDRQLTPRCMCACQSAEHDRREQERRQREFLDTVSRNRSLGLPDPTLRSHTFENDRNYNPRQSRIARQYVEHFDQLSRDGTGLLFWGDVGSGKSFLAGCIANALLDRGVRVIMTNFPRLLNQLTDLHSGDRNGWIDSFSSYRLMIIDDLGVERNSEFALEQVFSIVDSRCRSGLPMIVTTNLNMDELKQPRELARSRIYDRILERCMPVLVTEQNIRRLNQNAARERSLALLEDS